MWSVILIGVGLYLAFCIGWTACALFRADADDERAQARYRGMRRN